MRKNITRMTSLSPKWLLFMGGSSLQQVSPSEKNDLAEALGFIVRRLDSSQRHEQPLIPAELVHRACTLLHCKTMWGTPMCFLDEPQQPPHNIFKNTGATDHILRRLFGTDRVRVGYPRLVRGVRRALLELSNYQLEQWNAMRVPVALSKLISQLMSVLHAPWQK